MPTGAWQSMRAWRYVFLAGAVGVSAVAPVVGTTTGGQSTAGSRLAFVACPIVRDTATLPCWLAEFQGELYYLGTQGSTSSAFYPPQLLHEALVEATVVDGPRVCGGKPLAGVEVSVLPEINRACNMLLPAEPGVTAPASPQAPIPRFADTTLAFTIAFDFDSDYLTLHTTRVLEEAVRIAGLRQPQHIEVFGRRGATRLTAGGLLVEREGLAEGRARKVAGMLVGLGLPGERVKPSWQTDPDATPGVDDVSRRRLTITFR